MEPELTDFALLTRHVAAELLTKIGYRITYNNLQVMACRNQGPKVTKFGKEPLYRVRDLRSWLEGRVGMSIREAIELGRLNIPPELRGCMLWNDDNQPVGPSQVQDAA